MRSSRHTVLINVLLICVVNYLSILIVLLIRVVLLLNIRLNILLLNIRLNILLRLIVLLRHLICVTLPAGMNRFGRIALDV